MDATLNRRATDTLALRIPHDDYARLYQVLCTAAMVLAAPEGEDRAYWLGSLRRDVEAYQAQHPSPFIGELLAQTPAPTRGECREEPATLASPFVAGLLRQRFPEWTEPQGGDPRDRGEGPS